MAAISASSFATTGGFIDPSKQAEYPIVLGDKLAGRQSAKNTRLINVQYNYKSKSATPQQRSVITPSSRAEGMYDLTITDKPPNTEQNSSLVYTYEGSIDPATRSMRPEERDLVLVFDPDRKVFVLDHVSTRLHFNLRSAPGKTEKQVLEQYPQLKTLADDGSAPGDDHRQGNTSGEDEPADESNPYDYRHFLPKVTTAEDSKSTLHIGTPELRQRESQDAKATVSAPREPTTAAPPVRKKTPQTNPLRQKKKSTNKPPKSARSPIAQSQPETPALVETVDLLDSASVQSDGDLDGRSQKASPSPAGSNIIIDGDLIIDMGSPPPSRPQFKVNPAYFSSNNTPSNHMGGDDDDGEELDSLQLPSPMDRTSAVTKSRWAEAAPADEDEMEDDDALAAEMEAAFEETAWEQEQARSQQYGHQTQQRQYNAPSEDESEVSEEE